MYIHEQLMKAQQDNRLRVAARHRLVAQARRSRHAATVRPLRRAAGHAFRLLPRVSARPALAGARPGRNA
jgi:hypothetical protein